MRKILMMLISGIYFCSVPVQAQFNTVAQKPGRYKVEVLQKGMEKPEPVESMAPVQDTSAKPADGYEKSWIGRYLSVSYPLRRIKITSPYGYRQDPFTGKKKFHGGIDLHARGEQVLAMMDGRVVKVGHDKVSGKYVTLQHGNYTVSYCHLSQILTFTGAAVRPRDAVGITGSTGRSSGEHLHITCKLNGKNVNPSVLFDYIRATQQECVSALVGL